MERRKFCPELETFFLDEWDVGINKCIKHWVDHFNQWLDIASEGFEAAWPLRTLSSRREMLKVIERVMLIFLPNDFINLWIAFGARDENR